MPRHSTQTNKHAHAHAHAHAHHAHTRAHTHTGTQAHAHTSTRKHARTRAHTHASTHARARTRIRTQTHTHTHTHTLISRGCSCRHAIVLKGHEKINLQCKCHIIETEHEANSGKPRKHIRSRKDGRYAGMANSGIPSCCLALLDQVSSKTPGPPAMWNFRPCSRTLHTHGAPAGATSLAQGPLSLASINCARKSCGDD